VGLNPSQLSAFQVAKALLIAGRGHLFESPTKDIPHASSDIIAKDDLIPQLGFVGSTYEVRRILVLGINPGNGPRASRSAADAQMMPALYAFVSNPEEVTYAAAMQAQMDAFPNWLASKEIGPILENEGVARNEIAYANASPYRAGKGDAKDAFPSKARERLAAIGWVLPLLTALTPKIIIAHGKKAADVIQHCDFQAKILVYNRNHIQVLRSEANTKFKEQLRLALESR
jgi:hypothetical protein